MPERHRTPSGRRCHRRPHGHTSEGDRGALELAHRQRERVGFVEIRRRFQCTPGDLLLHPAPLAPRQFGLIREHVDDRRIEVGLEQGQQLGPHAVAGNADIAVGFVLDVRNAPRREVLAQIGAAALDQRPDDDAAARMHRGKSARTGSTQQPQQKRLGLIVTCVADRDHICVEVRRGPARKTHAGPRAPRPRRTAVRASPGAARPRVQPESARPSSPASETQNRSSRSAADTPDASGSTRRR